jgi:hypothetical protein
MAESPLTITAINPDGGAVCVISGTASSVAVASAAAGVVGNGVAVAVAVDAAVTVGVDGGVGEGVRSGVPPHAGSSIDNKTATSTISGSDFSSLTTLSSTSSKTWQADALNR